MNEFLIHRERSLMKQEEIVKVVLEEVSTAVLTTSVRDKAAELLGYQCKTEIDYPTETDGALRNAIARLGIETLDVQSVLRYQAERLAESLMASGLNITSTSRYDDGWNRRKLSEYKQPIPDFALERALQLKATCPEVEFMVEELAKDPFLIAYIPSGSYGAKEAYYIACWEEARFEATL